ncbi:hypothetical protein [Azonexus sp. R2A61]|uniref:hypothetical protein n=1 Tax=Azonexus sp. R2A61 TaxID=2744443 RepID=UPI001F1C30C1|nr:hypothetical protein [Azonexus sp. R2A61]
MNETATPIAEETAPLVKTPALPTLRLSVTVNQVNVRDLLFALARDARLNLDIAPELDGRVTLNAVDQPLDAILARLSRQIPMRIELHEDSLRVTPDTPYLKHYPINYLNQSRKVQGSISNSMQIGAAAMQGSIPNQSTTRIENNSQHHFWENIEKALSKALGKEQTPKTDGDGQAPYLIVNPEAGLVSAFATQAQHHQLQQLIGQAESAVRRQVLIEATIVEVSLSEGHEQGIDWSGLMRSGLIEYSGNSLKGAVNLRYNRNANPSALISLLDSYGTARVLSSPRLSVLNNQTALLKVVENYVYFSVKADTTTTANVGTTVTYSTTPQTVAVGLVMGVTPQIAADYSVVLNVRPTITSIGREIADPNPDLRKNGIENLVPVIRTREIESVMRVANGQIAVLGGLMEERVDFRTNRLPALGDIPVAGELFTNRNNQSRKTELVIFLRPVAVIDPDIRSDYAHLADTLPGESFLHPPAHARRIPGHQQGNRQSEGAP